MRVEMETIIELLAQEVKPRSSLIGRGRSVPFDVDTGIMRGVIHCINLLTKVNGECSKDIGKYLSLSGERISDSPWKGGPKY